MKRFYYLLAAMTFTVTGFAQAIEDDIYYDGRKAEKQQAEQRSLQPKVTYGDNDYISSWRPSIEKNRDVDEYNRYGFYYVTPIDTIGAGIADSEDFVYTQQIQKYYNPTIVVDNASILADILDNSYGNVNVIYGATGPAFSSWHNLPYFEAYTPWGGFYSSLNWGWYTGWFDPWYRISAPWGYGWGWGWSAPGWGWGWNAPFWDYAWCYPGWGLATPGSGWIWDLGPGVPGWSFRPENHRPAVGVRPGWSRNTNLHNNHLSTNTNNRLYHNVTTHGNNGRNRGTYNNRGGNTTIGSTPNPRLNNRTIDPGRAGNGRTTATTNRHMTREFDTKDLQRTDWTPVGGTGKSTGNSSSATTPRTHGNFNSSGYLQQNRTTLNNGSTVSPRVTPRNTTTTNGVTNRSTYTSRPGSSSSSNYSTQSRSNNSSSQNSYTTRSSSYSGSTGSGSSSRSSSFSSGGSGGGRSSSAGRSGGGGGGGRSGGRR